MAYLTCLNSELHWTCLTSLLHVFIYDHFLYVTCVDVLTQIALFVLRHELI